MRAGTLFAMTRALLIGLGVAVAARWAGLLGKAPEPPKKEKEIQILVAARNLFPGDVIDASGVKTRACGSHRAFVLVGPAYIEFWKFRKEQLNTLLKSAHDQVQKSNLTPSEPGTPGENPETGPTAPAGQP